MTKIRDTSGKMCPHPAIPSDGLIVCGRERIRTRHARVKKSTGN